GSPRWQARQLSARQRWEIEQKLPANLPDAQLIDSIQLRDLLEALHQWSQAKLPAAERVPLSDAVEEHIISRLLHSQTMLKIENAWGLPLFALLKASYAPQGLEERVFTSVEDTANYFRLMKEWANRSPHTMRIIEELDVPLERLEEAMNELDILVRSWANRYHQAGSKAMTIQMAFGEK
ncbi:heterocyst differentiation control protein, partial [Leptolyngbya sp. FACHB-261]|nr:heterocyst differentiation control protein [Leptolyngbya sp. FACHB-261]